MISKCVFPLLLSLSVLYILKTLFLVSNFENLIMLSGSSFVLCTILFYKLGLTNEEKLIIIKLKEKYIGNKLGIKHE